MALHFAKGNEVRSLTLIEPAAFHVLKGRDADALAEISEVGHAVTAALTRGDYAAGMERFYDYWSVPGAWARLPQEKRASLTGYLAKVALDFHVTLGSPERAAGYGAVAAPVLLIQGTRSPAPTRRICRMLAEVLPDVRVKTIEGAGHLCPITHRDAVNILIAAHLESKRDRSRYSDPVRAELGSAQVL